MNTIYTDKQKALDRLIESRLPDKRRRHSLGVARMAVDLARHYGLDEGKADFAGRYHDIAKAFTVEESDELVRKYGLPDKLLGNRSIAHSKVGAALLEHEFGVTDPDILAGVANHTTGRAGMSLFEEIIFVADAVDETRDYHDVQYYRDLAFEDIDRACLEIMDFNIEHVKSRGKVLDEDTLSAREYIIEKIRSRKT
ncbi:MAG: bis(5'-nucleosyl)-tetraphosphatase (symmetrical) YqeK [Mogibacterium sp.]|nr:bis(5'-nucleosyl)-tetraphosphatase (symmetrical) YqeK [Mogibacterium sp.]